jgi:hypothetical protein
MAGHHSADLTMAVGIYSMATWPTVSRKTT